MAKSIVLKSSLSLGTGAYGWALETEVKIPALPYRWGWGSGWLQMTSAIHI